MGRVRAFRQFTPIIDKAHTVAQEIEAWESSLVGVGGGAHEPRDRHDQRRDGVRVHGSGVCIGLFAEICDLADEGVFGQLTESIEDVEGADTLLADFTAARDALLRLTLEAAHGDA